MNLSFIGPRGVGKSKISRKLSKITGIPLVSTDMLAIYETGGISIPEFISQNNGNWKVFRDLEFTILNRLQSAKNLIIDCGGGIVFDLDDSGKEILSERKVSLLKKIGKVIRLDADISFLVRKVEGDSNRPTLSHTESYENILRRRTIDYNKVADISISVDMKNPEEIVRKIIMFFPDLQRK